MSWSPQIKEFYPDSWYFAPSGAMSESGMAGPHLDYWGPYTSREMCLQQALKCHQEALEILGENEGE